MYFLNGLKIVSNTISFVHSRVRAARRLACLTLGKSVFPRAVQGLLDEVPELTTVNELHLSPHQDTNPLMESPRNTVEIAVLS